MFVSPADFRAAVRREIPSSIKVTMVRVSDTKVMVQCLSRPAQQAVARLLRDTRMFRVTEVRYAYGVVVQDRF